MFKLGLVHLDIKLANVFYYIKDGTLKIILGDIGGIQTIETLTTTQLLVPNPTYCPIEFLKEFMDDRGYHPNDTRFDFLRSIEDIGKILSWQIGTLIVEFFYGFHMATSLIWDRTSGSPRNRDDTLRQIIGNTTTKIEQNNDTFSIKLIKILTDCLKFRTERPTIKQLYYDY